LRGADGVLGEGDRAAAISVEEVYDLLRCPVFLFLRDMVRGFVEETVSLLDVFGRPLVAAVEVVEVEEGAGVEGGYVVLFCTYF